MEQLQEIVLASRPQAEVKLVTSLGAVVGTHAGPGTVGFFWFQDAVRQPAPPRASARLRSAQSGMSRPTRLAGFAAVDPPDALAPRAAVSVRSASRRRSTRSRASGRL